jgi:hypothetical protein
MAVVSGLLPTTGVPLPFLSFGGSSLTLTLFGVGVLLNVSRRAGEAGQGRLAVRTPQQVADGASRAYQPLAGREASPMGMGAQWKMEDGKWCAS